MGTRRVPAHRLEISVYETEIREESAAFQLRRAGKQSNITRTNVVLPHPKFPFVRALVETRAHARQREVVLRALGDAPVL